MKQYQTLRGLFNSHWFSWLLLVMAYTTYGAFLHHGESSALLWGVTAALAVWGAWAITLGWPQMRGLLLLGFQSDLGYFVMALTMASVAVAAVTQFQRFTYFILLLAVSILARVDKLVAGYNDTLAFLLLSLLSLLGLALSWVPTLLGMASSPGGNG